MTDIDLNIRGVTKRFGDIYAVKDSNLAIAKGEIVSFLGPSGCGKSTLLNIIAGFIEPDEGEIRIAGEPIDHLPPNKRQTSLVFQHYALFPHMTVRDNISYGLEAARAPADTIATRVAEMVALLKLNGLEKRYPAELSGGQRQRVAVARALAVRPKILLLDEALSALDKNLREEMQIELSLLLRSLRITTILVTHDQKEAFAVSDKIALMEKGRIVQVGTPQKVYAHPASEFVLRFLGSANGLAGRMVAGASGALVAETASGLRVSGGEQSAPFASGDAVDIFIRSEDIQLSSVPTPVHPAQPAKVKLVTFLGSTRRYIIDMGGEQVVVDSPPAVDAFDAGSDIFLKFQPANCHVLAQARN